MDTPSFDHTADLIFLGRDALLAVIGHNDLRHEAEAAVEIPSHVTVVVVDRAGKKSAERRLANATNADTLGRISAVHVRDNNEVVIAVPRFERDLSEHSVFSLRTGRFEHCWQTASIDLIVLDDGELSLKLHRRVEGMIVRDMAMSDTGEIWAASSLFAPCELESDIGIVRIDANYEAEVIYRSGGPFSQGARGLAFVGNDQIAVVGSVELPSGLKEHGPPELFVDELWLRQMDDAPDVVPYGAFIAVISRDGELISDEIIYDSRRRGYSDITSLGSNKVIAVGQANGGDLWYRSIVIENLAEARPQNSMH